MAKKYSAFWPARKIISLFVEMGCIYNIAEQTMTDSDGEIYGLAYLVNPETGGFQPILDLADDDLISLWEVESWERRLGVIIPKPPGDG